ncbi:MAG: flagellar biosynthetic protein FliO [Phycisphaerales bacterium]|nr:flagellar biosynthetic protein FliO [Phycisphaerales bacterium]
MATQRSHHRTPPIARVLIVLAILTAGMAHASAGHDWERQLLLPEAGSANRALDLAGESATDDAHAIVDQDGDANAPGAAQVDEPAESQGETRESATTGSADQPEKATEPAEVFVPPARESLPLGQTERASPTTAEATGYGAIGVMRTLGALVVVIVLALLLKMVIKRAASARGGLAVMLSAGGRAPSGVMEVLGRYPISRSTTLVLLKLDRRVLLLSQTPAGFQTLADIIDADDVASILSKTSTEQSETVSDRFRSIFARVESGQDVDDLDLRAEVVDLTESANPLKSLRMRLSTMRGADA